MTVGSPLGGGRTLSLAAVALVVAVLAPAYLLYPWVCRISATDAESRRPLPGDRVVAEVKTGYTLATTIAAAPREVWPWLVQMGQGRGGFYTHEWIENLLGADMHNADRILEGCQGLAVGDSVRLTPDPYLGQRGQFITVSELRAPSYLVFRQTMPNGAPGSWTFVLEPYGQGTRLLFRRRAGTPTAFDRVMLPGYYLMDRGMLTGIRERAERRKTAARSGAELSGRGARAGGS